MRVKERHCIKNCEYVTTDFTNQLFEDCIQPIKSSPEIKTSTTEMTTKTTTSITNTKTNATTPISTILSRDDMVETTQLIPSSTNTNTTTSRGV